MMLDIIIMVIPPLILSGIITLLARGDKVMFMVLLAVGSSIIITNNGHLDASYLVIPILLLSISMYIVAFGGGNDE